MLSAKSLFLASALLAGVADAQTGCYTPYVSGMSYSASDYVSATTTCTEEVSCTVGTSGCGSDGTKTVTSSETYNYQCVDGPAAAFCSQSGYAPGGSCDGTSYWSVAWTRESTTCSVSF